MTWLTSTQRLCALWLYSSYEAIKWMALNRGTGTGIEHYRQGCVLHQSSSVYDCQSSLMCIPAPTCFIGLIDTYEPKNRPKVDGVVIHPKLSTFLVQTQGTSRTVIENVLHTCWYLLEKYILFIHEGKKQKFFWVLLNRIFIAWQMFTGNNPRYILLRFMRLFSFRSQALNAADGRGRANVPALWGSRVSILCPGSGEHWSGLSWLWMLPVWRRGGARVFPPCKV